jgi:Protein of unknown function (DUF3592)
MTDPNPVTYGSTEGAVTDEVTSTAGRLASDNAWVTKVGYLFAVIAVGLLTAAALTYISKSKFVDRAVRAEGTVVDVELKTSRSTDSSRRTTSRYPVVEFQARNEQRVRFTSSASKSGASVGDRVTVLYDPSNPRDASLSGVGQLWLLPIIFGGIGIFFAGFAVLILKVLRSA